MPQRRSELTERDKFILLRLNSGKMKEKQTLIRYSGFLSVVVIYIAGNLFIKAVIQIKIILGNIGLNA